MGKNKWMKSNFGPIRTQIPPASRWKVNLRIGDLFIIFASAHYSDCVVSPQVVQAQKKPQRADVLFMWNLPREKQDVCGRNVFQETGSDRRRTRPRHSHRVPPITSSWLWFEADVHAGASQHFITEFYSINPSHT